MILCYFSVLFVYYQESWTMTTCLARSTRPPTAMRNNGVWPSAVMWSCFDVLLKKTHSLDHVILPFFFYLATGIMVSWCRKSTLGDSKSVYDGVTERVYVLVEWPYEFLVLDPVLIATSSLIYSSGITTCDNLCVESLVKVMVNSRSGSELKPYPEAANDDRYRNRNE